MLGLMHIFDFVWMGVVWLCGLVCLLSVPSRSVKRLAILAILVAALLGGFSVSLAHRLAWYTPERERRVAYSEADKEKFSEGAGAARDSAVRFLPVLLSSVFVLTIVSYRRI